MEKSCLEVERMSFPDIFRDSSQDSGLAAFWSFLRLARGLFF